VISTVAALPLSRLTRVPRAWVPVLAWAALAVVSALVLRRSGTSATGGALEAIFGGYALPLLTFTVVGGVLGGDGLARSTRPFAAFGAPPAGVAAVTVGVAVVASALVAALVGAAVAALSHGSTDPPLALDALTSAWVAALGAAAYAAFFSFGASFGRRGGGRAVALVVDWVLGASTGAAGLPVPRAHVRSLLGGDAVMALSGRVSALALVAIVVVFGALAAGRARRG
jgi:hypothetical protein